MASGTLGDSHDDFNRRWRCRWTENCKVYTRKIYKKAEKTSNDNDTGPSTTSIAGNPTSAGLTTSENLITERSEVSSGTAAAEYSPASTSEYPDNCAAASPPPTTSHHTTVGGHAVQETPEAVVTKGVGSDQRLQKYSPHEIQNLPRGSPDKDADSSSPHQPQSHSPRSLDKDADSSLQQSLLPQLPEENYSTENRARKGSGSENAKLQDLVDSLMLHSNEPQNLKTPSPFNSANELPQTSRERPQNLRDSSPFSGEKDLSNGREVAVAQLPMQAQNDGEMMPGSSQVPQGNGSVNANGVVKPLMITSVGDSIRFNLCKSTPKNEIKELRKKLDCELDQVRRIVKQLEAKERQLASYNTQISNSNISNSSNYINADGANIGGYSHLHPQHARSDVVDQRVLVRVNAEVVAVGHQETRPMGLARVNSDMGAARNLETRPYSRQLSVSVMENNHRTGEFFEKEKRTPKANQYYRNSEFLLGKDRLPPEGNKRLKTNNGRKHSGDAFGLGLDKIRNQVFKRCSSLLQRLMRHKHGWVFNEPVNAKALGLVDYHDIIKHPMDLGTIKTRLSQNWYKSPREFADDVRLVFRNAMTYNPKGQDVHVMAEQLLQIFEEKWAIIETEYSPHWKYQMYQDGGLPTPTSRRALPRSHFTLASVPVSAPAPIPTFIPAAPQMRTFDRSEPVTTTMAVDPKIHRPHVGRTPVPKKPKAKDPNKRDMTYEEKQRLSTNLQSLPPEKLDSILQIIKRRNTELSQNDDEIEVDIDSVDPETLWELDRFVTNYKKSLSKNKRKAELARQATNQNVALMNQTPAIAAQIESGAAFEKTTATPAEGEKHGYNGSRSSSSSSSSSDSGSSSSDSDSDSSSGDGSDAGHSPRT